MSKPTKCISVTEGKELQASWVTSRAATLKTLIGGDDSREVFWSVDELQEFLDYVKEMSASQGIINPGVRVYFAAHNTDSNNKATVILAPTNGNSSASNNNYNIDPLNGGVTGWPPNNY
ncbi:hypothetical protein [Ulvibacter antarcticus]|uniref:Uncharacterized protein n=1 Tax=Ulvibacter antarcticus TaxID=442714 RepID=A0A3L9YH42_9FLAO|nr:hypothetical protein [Ulvibacter antarcticus]RMA58877.1 hypothetical protein BXY75_2257 [Ulvibacter antarcticus]